jgi:monoamine oxidase
MKRRKFIQKTLQNGALIMASPSLLAACKNEAMPITKSVLIIGAGISGLAAAQKLKEKGLKVTILEAQDKMGGRLCTNRTLEFPFDEGASWIHGINGNPITDLAQKQG